MGSARYQTLDSVQSSLSRSSQPYGTIYLAAAVAALCAAIVFFLLYQRDHSLLLQATGYISQPTVIQDLSPAPAQSPAQPAVTSPSAQAASPSKEQIPFTLERSRRFHRIGPISVGLWRVDSRRGTVDLSILAYGHRTNRNRIKVDEKISMNSKDPARPLELTVKKIDKNSVSGYLEGG